MAYGRCNECIHLSVCVKVNKMFNFIKEFLGVPVTGENDKAFAEKLWNALSEWCEFFKKE